jgi:hypothetical protein
MSVFCTLGYLFLGGFNVQSLWFQFYNEGISTSMQWRDVSGYNLRFPFSHLAALVSSWSTLVALTLCSSFKARRRVRPAIAAYRLKLNHPLINSPLPRLASASLRESGFSPVSSSHCICSSVVKFSNTVIRDVEKTGQLEPTAHIYASAYSSVHLPDLRYSNPNPRVYM